MFSIPDYTNPVSFLNAAIFQHLAPMLNTVIGRLRLIGFIEGTSMLFLLFIAMPLKYFADSPLAVKYVGWAHGILFMLFMAAAFHAYLHYKWPFKRLIYAFLAAFFPFGTFVWDRWLKKQERIEAL